MTRRSVLRAAALLVSAALLAAAPGCSSKKSGPRIPALADPAYASQLYDEGMRELASRKFRKARTTLERIQIAAADRPRLEPLVRLGIADATFFMGGDASMIEARAKYLDFVLVYGDHPKAPYAQFQAGMCSLKQVRDGSRDQSQTAIAVTDFQEIEKRFPDSSYARASRQRIDVAEANLAEHEYVVGRFYYQKKKYFTAASRLRGVLEKYPRYRDRQKVYFYLGQALLKANSDAEGKIYLDKLVKDYPEGKYAPEAKRILARQDAREQERKRTS